MIILLDCNALCYQAHFTTRNLSRSDGTPTGVVYGFWQQVKSIVEQCDCARLVFCWDSDKSIRMAMCNTYKADRDKKREQDPTIFEAFYQFEEIRKMILPKLGFKNNFIVDGYEADDIIASICKNEDEEIVIASNDQDLYQLLTPKIRMYKPVKGQHYTMKNFVDEYGIQPEQWVYVKAIAGCPGDNVIGIHGVGAKTVISFLTDTTGKKFPKINNSEAKKIISRNWPLVCLPLDNTPAFSLTWPEMNYQNWKEFCNEYELHSFLKGQFFRDLFLYQSPSAYVPPPQKRKHKGKSHRNAPILQFD